MKGSVTFRDMFGDSDAHYQAMLIIGRDQEWAERELSRLRWRLNKVLVDSRPVICKTMDQLWSELQETLTWYKSP